MNTLDNLSVADLEAALTAAKTREAAEAKARRESVVPVWKYSFLPVTDDYRDLRPNSGCTLYKLDGEITNIAEVEAVGGPTNGHKSGTKYLVNSLNKTIVMSMGSGYYSIGFDGDRSEAHEDALDRLEAFVAAFPEGGDITDIVKAYQAADRSK